MQAVLEPIATSADAMDWDPAAVRRRPPLISPVHVLGRCSHCHSVVSEGDWYCLHLAAALGHQIAHLADRLSPRASEPQP